MGKGAVEKTKMFVRRGSTTTVNGFVQQRNPRTARRRNAVANIFSELSEGDIRALRQQAAGMLHPASQASSASSSSSEDLDVAAPSEARPRVKLLSASRRRRNALHDIGEGIDHAQLQQLRDQALVMHHPAAMMTTPPGASGSARPAAFRSISLCIAASGGGTDTLSVPDDSGASTTLHPPRPSASFTVDSVSDAAWRPSLLPRSTSSRYPSDLMIDDHLHAPPSPADNIITITETDGDIFRERISRSSTRYRERRNAVCYEDATQVFLNNIITAVMRCRQQRREAANKAFRDSPSD